jgi:hypothetical protein
VEELLIQVRHKSSNQQKRGSLGGIRKTRARTKSKYNYHIPSFIAAALTMGKYCPQQISCLAHGFTHKERKMKELTGVPNPVAASQPSFAGNPVVLQPTELPFVISVNALKPTE